MQLNKIKYKQKIELTGKPKIQESFDNIFDIHSDYEFLDLFLYKNLKNIPIPETILMNDGFLKAWICSKFTDNKSMKIIDKMTADTSIKDVITYFKEVVEKRKKANVKDVYQHQFKRINEIYMKNTHVAIVKTKEKQDVKYLTMTQLSNLLTESPAIIDYIQEIPEINIKTDTISAEKYICQYKGDDHPKFFKTNDTFKYKEDNPYSHFYLPKSVRHEYKTDISETERDKGLWNLGSEEEIKNFLFKTFEKITKIYNCYDKLNNEYLKKVTEMIVRAIEVPGVFRIKSITTNFLKMEEGLLFYGIKELKLEMANPDAAEKLREMEKIDLDTIQSLFNSASNETKKKDPAKLNMVAKFSDKLANVMIEEICKGDFCDYVFTEQERGGLEQEPNWKTMARNQQRNHERNVLMLKRVDDLKLHNTIPNRLIQQIKTTSKFELLKIMEKYRILPRYAVYLAVPTLKFETKSVKYDESYLKFDKNVLPNKDKYAFVQVCETCYLVYSTFSKEISKNVPVSLDHRKYVHSSQLYFQTQTSKSLLYNKNAPKNPKRVDSSQSELAQNMKMRPRASLTTDRLSTEISEPSFSSKITKKILNQILTSNKLVHSISTSTFDVEKKIKKKLLLKLEDEEAEKSELNSPEKINYNLFKGTYLTPQGLSAISNLVKAKDKRGLKDMVIVKSSDTLEIIQPKRSQRKTNTFINKSASIIRAEKSSITLSPAGSKIFNLASPMKKSIGHIVTDRASMAPKASVLIKKRLTLLPLSILRKINRRRFVSKFDINSKVVSIFYRNLAHLRKFPSLKISTPKTSVIDGKNPFMEKTEIAELKIEHICGILKLNLPITDLEIEILVLDEKTCIPYSVIKSKNTSILKNREVLVFFNDFFDNYIQNLLFYKDLIANQENYVIILFNYPGQAFSLYNEKKLLNNEELSNVVEVLLLHLEKKRVVDFASDNFRMIGYGLGGNVLLFFLSEALSAISNLRGALIFNGFLNVDDFILKNLENALYVVESAKTRDDVWRYLQTVMSMNICMNEKVLSEKLDMNPINIQSMAYILKGCFQIINMRDLVKYVRVPMLVVSSTKDSFIPSYHSSEIVATNATQTDIEEIHEMFSQAKSRLIINSLEAGHNVLEDVHQETVKIIKKFIHCSLEPSLDQKLAYVDKTLINFEQDCHEFYNVEVSNAEELIRVVNEWLENGISEASGSEMREKIEFVGTFREKIMKIRKDIRIIEKFIDTIKIVAPDRETQDFMEKKVNIQRKKITEHKNYVDQILEQVYKELQFERKLIYSLQKLKKIQKLLNKFLTPHLSKFSKLMDNLQKDFLKTGRINEIAVDTNIQMTSEHSIIFADDSQREAEEVTNDNDSQVIERREELNDLQNDIAYICYKIRKNFLQANKLLRNIINPVKNDKIKLIEKGLCNILKEKISRYITKILYFLQGLINLKDDLTQDYSALLISGFKNTYDHTIFGAIMKRSVVIEEIKSARKISLKKKRDTHMESNNILSNHKRTILNTMKRISANAELRQKFNDDDEISDGDQSNPSDDEEIGAELEHNRFLKQLYNPFLEDYLAKIISFSNKIDKSNSYLKIGTFPDQKSPTETNYPFLTLSYL